MMHPPKPLGYQQPQTHQEVRCLWIGALPNWVDENYLTSCFSETRELVSAKVIRNKITGHSEGYGFLEFVSHEAAGRTLQTYAGTNMPGTESKFRLNWASFGSRQKVDAEPDHSIHVGNLAPEVTEDLLLETFRVHYSSVRSAKVVIAPSTGLSKGYGFVKFAEESERNRAVAEMNGLLCSTKPMLIEAAKKSVVVPKQHVPKAVYPVQDPSAVAAADPNQGSGYYNYGQGYDAYAYGVTQDQSLYAYGGYGYPQYPQQGEGSSQEVTNSAAADQELYDPLAPPDVDKLNAAYLSVHASSILGRPMWHCLSAHSTNGNRRT